MAATKKKRRAVRGATPTASKAAPHHPQHREVIEIHTTRETKRNASGGVLDGSHGTIMPILGGIAGGAAAVAASQKWNAHPGLVAAGTAAAGLGVMAYAKSKRNATGQQLGAGAVVGAAVVGAVPLLMGALHRPAHQAAQTRPTAPAGSARGAGGDGLITREELNDALDKLADSHKQVQKQQTCDLLSALRDEIRKVVAETPPALPASSDARAVVAPTLSSRQTGPSFTYPLEPSQPSTKPSPEPKERDADGDDYGRNAYGDDLRDAAGDEYRDSAYGDDIRDAASDDYERNAYLDERDSGVSDYERNADVEERNSEFEDRNANGDSD